MLTENQKLLRETLALVERQQELAVTTAENLQSQTKGLTEALIRFGEAVETDLDELKNFQIRIAEASSAGLDELKNSHLRLGEELRRIAEELRNAHLELAKLVEAFVRASGDGRRRRE